jgi:hypothetical protein
MKRLIIVLYAALVLTIAGGTVATVSTAHAYANVCSRLNGFPGLLQRAGLTGNGQCQTHLGGYACSAGNTCATAYGAGICKNIAVSGPQVCECVPVIPSHR